MMVEWWEVGNIYTARVDVNARRMGAVERT